MFRKSLVNIGLRVQRDGVHRATAGLSPVNYGDIGRRDASSSSTTTSTTAATAAVMGDNFKLKTIDDLGGPSFMKTLYWLLVKGHLQTAQQMQVSGTRR